MTLKKLFQESIDYSCDNSIFYMRSAPSHGSYERLYCALREKEGRVYPDQIVKLLPEFPQNYSLHREWQLRKFSSQNLISYFSQKEGGRKILELGCGNGWLSNRLASLPGSEVLGVDINETELLQAARVFSERKNLCFAYADILTCEMPYSQFQYIILSASIQYFSDLNILVKKLLTLLSPTGEIHILDSPFYPEKHLPKARKRSEKYFIETGFPEMSKHYYHHSFESLKPFHPRILYQPANFFNKIRSQFLPVSPFPWMMLPNESAATSRASR